MGFLLFWWWKWPSVFIQDVCVVLSIAGAGSILGLTISPETAVFFLIIFSAYDIVAVYKTKHMVKMAKEMIESRAILGLVIPSSIIDFKSSLSEIKPGGKFLILGGGDVVLPLFLCSSIISSGQPQPLIVAVFSLIGVFFSFLFFIFQKDRRPIPALPPIAFFSIIGFLLTRVL
jgi:presenilin-like A22 family membrane protease